MSVSEILLIVVACLTFTNTLALIAGYREVYRVRDGLHDVRTMMAPLMSLPDRIMDIEKRLANV